MGPNITIIYHKKVVRLPGSLHNLHQPLLLRVGNENLFKFGSSHQLNQALSPFIVQLIKHIVEQQDGRSEERRVGKECSWGWSPLNLYIILVGLLELSALSILVA